MMSFVVCVLASTPIWRTYKKKMRDSRGLSKHADHSLLRYSLDREFATPEFAHAEMRRLRHAGSDHFPVLAALSCWPETAGNQPLPQTDKFDR